MAAQTDSAARKSAPKPEDLAEQLDTLREEVSALGRMLADLGADRAERAGEAAAARARDMRDTAEAQVGRLRQEVRQHGAEAERLMRDQPGTTLGLAAALGFVVGLVAARR